MSCASAAAPAAAASAAVASSSAAAPATVPSLVERAIAPGSKHRPPLSLAHTRAAVTQLLASNPKLARIVPPLAHQLTPHFAIDFSRFFLVDAHGAIVDPPRPKIYLRCGRVRCGNLLPLIAWVEAEPKDAGQSSCLEKLQWLRVATTNWAADSWVYLNYVGCTAGPINTRFDQHILSCHTAMFALYRLARHELVDRDFGIRGGVLGTVNDANNHLLAAEAAVAHALGITSKDSLNTGKCGYALGYYEGQHDDGNDGAAAVSSAPVKKRTRADETILTPPKRKALICRWFEQLTVEQRTAMGWGPCSDCTRQSILDTINDKLPCSQLGKDELKCPAVGWINITAGGWAAEGAALFIVTKYFSLVKAGVGTAPARYAWNTEWETTEPRAKKKDQQVEDGASAATAAQTMVDSA